MSIVIKKRVSFEFLGDEYKDSYIVLRAMPVKEYEEYLSKAQAIGDDGSKALRMIVEAIKSHFIEGKFLQDDKLQDIKVEDLEDLDGESIITLFKRFTGQELPKVPPEA